MEVQDARVEGRGDLVSGTEAYCTVSTTACRVLYCQYRSELYTTASTAFCSSRSQHSPRDTTAFGGKGRDVPRPVGVGDVHALSYGSISTRAARVIDPVVLTVRA